MPDKTRDELTATHVRLPAELLEALRKRATEQERSMAAELRVAVREYLAAIEEREGAAAA